MAKIVSQPWFSIWGLRAVYQFDLPARCREPVDEILSFYRRQPLRDLKVEPRGIQFSRGSLRGSLLSPNECRLKQVVTIRIPGKKVTAEYRCFVPIHIYLPPSKLFKEVEQLEAFLANPFGEGITSKKNRFGLTFIYRGLYRIYRVISASWYWSRRRLTPAGFCVAGALLATGSVGLDVDNTVTYQAFSLLQAFLILAFAVSWFFRARFSIQRSLPRLVTAGRPLGYQVRVKNLTARPQNGLTLLENLADVRPPFPDWLEFQRAESRRLRLFRLGERRPPNPFRPTAVREGEVPPLPPKGEREMRLEILPLRRGVLRFTGAALARTDPLGLFRACVTVSAPQTVLVLPKRYPLPPIALPGSMKYQEGGVALAANVGRSEEFVALRDYRRGDPLRHIHWRSWAKAGRPIVKEFEDEFFVRHALVLDTFTAEPHSEILEEAISVAASFACTVLTQESLLDLLFVGAKSYCFTAGRGLGQVDRMLEVLAEVRACRDQSFPTLEQLVLSHVSAVSGCVCVLLAWDEARRELVKKLQTIGMPVLVLVVVERRGAGLDPGPLRDEPHRFQVLELGRIEQDLARLTG